MIKEMEKLHEETETESNNKGDKSAADTSLYSHNASHVSHVSQIDNSVNIAEKQPAWPVGTPEQAEAFKEEVAKIGEKGKSKLTNMAEADMSGNGVMPENGQEK